MNSGPTGRVIVSRSMRSISRMEGSSSDQPATSAMASSCSGRRAPHSAIVGPRSRTHRIADASTLFPKFARASPSSADTAAKYWLKRGCWNFGSTRRKSSPPNCVADDILPLSNPRHNAP